MNFSSVVVKKTFGFLCAYLLLENLFSGVLFLRGMACQGNTAGIPLLACGCSLKCLKSFRLLPCSAPSKHGEKAIAFQTQGTS